MISRLIQIAEIDYIKDEASDINVQQQTDIIKIKLSSNESILSVLFKNGSVICYILSCMSSNTTEKKKQQFFTLPYLHSSTWYPWVPVLCMNKDQFIPTKGEKLTNYLTDIRDIDWLQMQHYKHGFYKTFPILVLHHKFLEDMNINPSRDYNVLSLVLFPSFLKKRSMTKQSLAQQLKPTNTQDHLHPEHLLCPWKQNLPSYTTTHNTLRIITLTIKWIKQLWNSLFDPNHCHDSLSCIINDMELKIVSPGDLCIRITHTIILLSCRMKGLYFVTSYSLVVPFPLPLTTPFLDKLYRFQSNNDALIQPSDVHDYASTISVLYILPSFPWLFVLIAQRLNNQSNNVFLGIWDISGLLFIMIPIIFQTRDHLVQTTVSTPHVSKYPTGLTLSSNNDMVLVILGEYGVIIHLTRVLNVILWKSQFGHLYDINVTSTQKYINARWRIFGHQLYHRVQKIRNFKESKKTLSQHDFILNSFDLLTTDMLSMTKTDLINIYSYQLLQTRVYQHWFDIFSIELYDFNHLFSIATHLPPELVHYQLATHLESMDIVTPLTFYPIGCRHYQDLWIYHRRHSKIDVSSDQSFQETQFNKNTLFFCCSIDLRHLPIEPHSLNILSFTDSGCLFCLGIEQPVISVSFMSFFLLSIPTFEDCDQMSNNTFPYPVCSVIDQIYTGPTNHTHTYHLYIQTSQQTSRHLFISFYVESMFKHPICITRLMPQKETILMPLQRLRNDHLYHLSYRLSVVNSIEIKDLPLLDINIGFNCQDLNRVERALHLVTSSTLGEQGNRDHELRVYMICCMLYKCFLLFLQTSKLKAHPMALTTSTYISHNKQQIPFYQIKYLSEDDILDALYQTVYDVNDDILDQFNKQFQSIIYNVNSKHLLIYFIHLLKWFIGLIICQYGLSLTPLTAYDSYHVLSNKNVLQTNPTLISRRRQEVNQLNKLLIMLRYFETSTLCQTHDADFQMLNRYIIHHCINTLHVRKTNDRIFKPLKQSLTLPFDHKISSHKMESYAQKICQTFLQGKISFLLKKPGITLYDARLIGCRLSYNILCSSRPEAPNEALTIIRSMGLSITHFCRFILWETSNRSLRHRLLSYQRALGEATFIEHQLFTLIDMLESEYSSPCYVTELNASWTAMLTGLHPIGYDATSYNVWGKGIRLSGSSYYPVGGYLAMQQGYLATYVLHSPTLHEIEDISLDCNFHTSWFNDKEKSYWTIYCSKQTNYFQDTLDYEQLKISEHPSNTDEIKQLSSIDDQANHSFIISAPTIKQFPHFSRLDLDAPITTSSMSMSHSQSLGLLEDKQDLPTKMKQKLPFKKLTDKHKKNDMSNVTTSRQSKLFTNEYLLPSQITTEAVLLWNRIIVGDIEDLISAPLNTVEHFGDVQHPSTNKYTHSLASMPPILPSHQLSNPVHISSDTLSHELSFPLSSPPISSQFSNIYWPSLFRHANYSYRQLLPSVKHLHILTGYLQITARWLQALDATDLLRIFLERHDPIEFLDLILEQSSLFKKIMNKPFNPLITKECHTLPGLFLQLMSIQDSKKKTIDACTTILQYLIDHQDWRNVIRWIQRIKLLSSIMTTTSYTIIIQQFLQTLLFNIQSMIIPNCHPFLLLILRYELICTQLHNQVRHRDQSSYQIIKEYAEMSCLLQCPKYDLDHVIHHELIRFCFQHEFIGFLLSYLKEYKIGETFNSCQSFHILTELPTMFPTVSSRTINNQVQRCVSDTHLIPGSKIVFLGRLGYRYHLITSLHYAARCCLNKDEKIQLFQDKDHIEFIPLDYIFTVLNDPLTYLGTLQFLPMHASVPAQLLAKMTSSNHSVSFAPWNLITSSFKKAIHLFSQIEKAYHGINISFVSVKPDDNWDSHQDITQRNSLTKQNLQLQCLLVQEPWMADSPFYIHSSNEFDHDQFIQSEKPYLFWEWDSKLPSFNNDCNIIQLISDITCVTLPLKLFIEPLQLPKNDQIDLWVKKETNEQTSRLSDVQRIYWTLIKNNDDLLEAKGYKQYQETNDTKLPFRNHVPLSIHYPEIIPLKLDERYFIAQCFPCVAFLCVVSSKLIKYQHLSNNLLTFVQHLHLIGNHYALSCLQMETIDFTTMFSKYDIIKYYKSAYEVALANLLNNQVVLSAVLFLDLLRIDSSILRIDIQCARRIYFYQKKTQKELIMSSLKSLPIIDHGNGNHEFNTTQNILGCVSKLFLSLPMNPIILHYNSNHMIDDLFIYTEIPHPSLLYALRLLEESARYMTLHKQHSWGDSSELTMGHHLGIQFPWRIVTAFCKVHRLPQSLTVLHELARNNNWLRFLIEAARQNCPKETMSHILSTPSFFTNLPLRQHLQAALTNSIASENDSKCHTSSPLGHSFLTTSSSRDAYPSQSSILSQNNHLITTTQTAEFFQIIQLMLSCRTTDSPMGWRILQWSIVHALPRLAVYATCFNSSAIPLCFLSNLYIDTIIRIKKKPQCDDLSDPSDTSTYDQWMTSIRRLQPSIIRLMERFRCRSLEEHSTTPFMGYYWNWNEFSILPYSLEFHTEYITSNKIQHIIFLAVFEAQCLGEFDLVDRLAVLFLSDTYSELLHLIRFHKYFIVYNYPMALKHLHQFIQARNDEIHQLWMVITQETCIYPKIEQFYWELITLFDAFCQHLFDTCPMRRIVLLEMLHSVRASPSSSYAYHAYSLGQSIHLQQQLATRLLTLSPFEAIELLISHQRFTAARSLLAYCSETLPHIYSEIEDLNCYFKDHDVETQEKNQWINHIVSAKHYLTDVSCVEHLNVTELSSRIFIAEAVSLLNELQHLQNIRLSLYVSTERNLETDALLEPWKHFQEFLCSHLLPSWKTEFIWRSILKQWKETLRPRELCFILKIILQHQKKTVHSSRMINTNTLQMCCVFLVILFTYIPSIDETNILLHAPLMCKEYTFQFITYFSQFSVSLLELFQLWPTDSFLIPSQWPSDSIISQLLLLIPEESHSQLIMPILKEFDVSLIIEQDLKQDDLEEFNVFSRLLQHEFQTILRKDIHPYDEIADSQEETVGCRLSSSNQQGSTLLMHTNKKVKNDQLQQALEKGIILLWSLDHVQTARQLEDYYKKFISIFFIKISHILELIYQTASVTTARLSSILTDKIDQGQVKRAELDIDDITGVTRIISQSLPNFLSLINKYHDRKPFQLLITLNSELSRLLMKPMIYSPKLSQLNGMLDFNLLHPLTHYFRRITVFWIISNLFQCSLKAVLHSDMSFLIFQKLMRYIHSRFLDILLFCHQQTNYDGYPTVSISHPLLTFPLQTFLEPLMSTTPIVESFEYKLWTEFILACHILQTFLVSTRHSIPLDDLVQEIVLLFIPSPKSPIPLNSQESIQHHLFRLADPFIYPTLSSVEYYRVSIYIILQCFNKDVIGLFCHRAIDYLQSVSFTNNTDDNVGIQHHTMTLSPPPIIQQTEEEDEKTSVFDDVNHRQLIGTSSIDPTLLILGIYTACCLYPNQTVIGHLSTFVLNPRCIHWLFSDSKKWGFLVLILGIFGKQIGIKEMPIQLHRVCWTHFFYKIGLFSNSYLYRTYQDNDTNEPFINPIVSQLLSNSLLLSNFLKAFQLTFYKHNAYYAICHSQSSSLLSTMTSIPSLWDTPIDYTRLNELNSKTLQIHAEESFLSSVAYYCSKNNKNSMESLLSITIQLQRFMDTGCLFLENCIHLIESLVDSNQLTMDAKETTLLLALEGVICSARYYKKSENNTIVNYIMQLMTLLSMEIHYVQSYLRREEVNQQSLLFLTIPLLTQVVIYHPNFSESNHILLIYEKMHYNVLIYQIWPVCLLYQMLIQQNVQYIKDYVTHYGDIPFELLNEILQIQRIFLSKETTHNETNRFLLSDLMDTNTDVDNLLMNIQQEWLALSYEIVGERWVQFLNICCSNLSQRYQILTELAEQCQIFYTSAKMLIANEHSNAIYTELHRCQIRLGNRTLLIPLAACIP